MVETLRKHNQERQTRQGQRTFSSKSNSRSPKKNTKEIKTWITKIYGIVISSEDKQVDGKCQTCEGMLQGKSRQDCQNQFANLKKDADRVADFYEHFGSC